MQFEWDPDKSQANLQKHGISLEDATELFAGGADYLEIYDDAHSQDEDRFIAIGPIQRGVIVVAYTERPGDVIRIVSARVATRAEAQRLDNYWRGKR